VPAARPTSPVGARPIAALAARLEVHVDDLGLLERALTHRSWAFEQGGVEPNERLEFLGDAVLGLVVADEIFHAHPDEQEGRLAKVRAAAVKAASLAEVARALGLGEFVKLGRGEAASGGADKDSILADALEAVIGAVYLDQGFATAYDLVERLFAEILARPRRAWCRARLQDEPAGAGRGPPRRAAALPPGPTSGPDHAKTFRARSSRWRVASSGVGEGAQQEAGRAAGRP
jgi:ribonuclease III